MTATPPVVSRFESNLLRLLRYALGHGLVEQVAPLVAAKFTPAPGCLSRTCVRLVEDTLAKGVVLFLVRAGGWRKERFIRGDGVAEGRVWDRWPLDERKLEFGPLPLAYFKWLTGVNPVASAEAGEAPAGEPTAADDLFFAIAYDHLRAVPDLARVIARQPVFRDNGLCRLLHPADFDAPPPSFEPWTSGLRAAALECLQGPLSARWAQSEREKSQVADWQAMAHRGQAEGAALTAYLAAAEKARRPDLARFVLAAAAKVLRTPDLTPAFWTGGLSRNRPPRLADRVAVERAALALPRQLETLQRWDRLARTVGYWDEGYDASQVWKADWEAAHGDEIATIARALWNQLDPL